jgi:hypothetical protein
MSIERYVEKDDAMEALENIVESVVKKILFPALEKMVLDSSNIYDDAALSLAKPMILKAIDRIDGKED